MSGPVAGPNTFEWDDNTTQQWIDCVEGWQWIHDKRENSYTKSGNCHRCGHRMDKVLRMGTGRFIAGRGDPLDVVEISCNCLEPHHRPEGRKTGCGQAGNFTPPEELRRRS